MLIDDLIEGLVHGLDEIFGRPYKSGRNLPLGLQMLVFASAILSVIPVLYIFCALTQCPGKHWTHKLLLFVFIIIVPHIVGAVLIKLINVLRKHS